MNIEDLDKLLSEAILNRENQDKSDSSSDDDEFNDLIREIEGDFELEDKLEDKLVEIDRRVTDKNTVFRHSKYGILRSGVYKGKEVDIKYTIPGKLELEVSVNENIVSYTELNKGDIIDNCVILTNLGNNMYLGSCKKVAFLDESDVIRIEGDLVEITNGPLNGIQGVIRNIYNNLKHINNSDSEDDDGEDEALGDNEVDGADDGTGDVDGAADCEANAFSPSSLFATPPKHAVATRAYI